jgi:hypothetical protein
MPLSQAWLIKRKKMSVATILLGFEGFHQIGDQLFLTLFFNCLNLC